MHTPLKLALVDENGIIKVQWYPFFNIFDQGYSGTIATAPLTTGGTPGSITFKNGIVTKQMAAT